MATVNSLTVEDLGSAAQRDRRKRILDATDRPRLPGRLRRRPDARRRRAGRRRPRHALPLLPVQDPPAGLRARREFETIEADPEPPRRSPATPRPTGSSTCSPRHPRPPGRPAAHRGADPRVHVRRRLGRRRDPRRRHAADHDAHPRDAGRRVRRGLRAHRRGHRHRPRDRRRLALRPGRLGHRPPDGRRGHRAPRHRRPPASCADLSRRPGTGCTPYDADRALAGRRATPPGTRCHEDADRTRCRRVEPSTRSVYIECPLSAAAYIQCPLGVLVSRRRRGSR